MDQIFKKLFNTIKAQSYRGYDPYDGSNTQIQWLRKYYGVRLFLTYFNKFSPINFRPVLSISQSRQIQCLAFIGLALIKYDPIEYSAEIEEICEVIKSETLFETYGYHCWDSHGFPIQMRGELLEPGIPDVVGSEACGRLLMAYYTITGDKLSREQAISFRDYLINVLYTKYDDSYFFRYEPTDPPNQCTYNASAVAANYVLEINRAVTSEKGIEEAYTALDYVISRQKPDGSWYYSIDLDTGREKKQIDFHQGFILDALLYALEIFPEATHFRTAYKKGLEFYYHCQFTNKGRGYYRLPKKWPVNIHSQAQGIITFTKAAAAEFGEDYHDFAKTIYDWTLINMSGNDGHFYYLKYPLFTNKVPYIRWSDANILYALSCFSNVQKDIT